MLVREAALKAIILKYLKGRFLPVTVFVVLISIFTKFLNIKEIVYAVVILTSILLFHSFLHELGHAIAAILLNCKIEKFSINRVFLEEDPSSAEEIINSKNRVKYGIIAISGSTMTILFGYILLYFAHNLRHSMKLFDFLCWIFTLIIFLIGDCGYLVTGSISMEGDPIGISAGFNISKWVVFCSGLIIAAVNAFLIWRFFWNI